MLSDVSTLTPRNTNAIPAIMSPPRSSKSPIEAGVIPNAAKASVKALDAVDDTTLPPLAPVVPLVVTSGIWP